jgi:phage host-nuclease inhibitor protein Gam
MVDEIWVDPATGEVVSPEADGAVRLEEVLVADHPSERDCDWLPDWLTGRLAGLDGQQEALTTQYNRRLAQLKAERRHLLWRYQARLEKCVNDALEAGGNKRKSVDYQFGRCGWKKSTRRFVIDEQAAVDWAARHGHEDAIRHHDPTILKSKLPDDCPAIEIVTEERFYINT